MMDSLLKLTTKQYPIALKAMKRSDIEVDITIENKSEKLLWVEIDVTVPPELSLSPVKELEIGKIRLGIFKPNQIKTKKIKIYSTAKTVPYEYKIHMLLLGHDEDAIIATRMEEKLYIRAVD